MIVVAAIADWLREHGLAVLLGSTILFGVFAVMIALTRAVVARRQLARLGLVAGLVYVGVALVPLPRWSPPVGLSAAAATVARTADAPPAPAIVAAVGDALPAAAAGAEVEPAVPAFATVGSTVEPTVEPTVESTVEPAAEPAAALTVEPAVPFDWAEPAAWGLLAGIALTCLHLLVGWWGLRRILTGSHLAATAVRQLAAVPRNVTVHIANRPVQPFCVGWWRRRIVLPPNLAEPSFEAACALRHEVAHLAAGDTRWRALATMMRPLLFWQPLFWWLQSQLRFSGEVLADHAAADGAVGNYVRAMVALASDPAPRVTGTAAAFMFHRRTELFRRLQMMLQRENVLSTTTSPRRRLVHIAATALLVTACGALFGAERAVAQEPGRGERLRAEVAELRAMNTALRDELEALRRHLEHESRATAPRGEPRIPGLPGASTEVGTIFYTVQAGDTFEKIAREYWVKPGAVQRLRVLNPDVDPKTLRVGQRLVIGSTETPRKESPVTQPRPPQGLPSSASSSKLRSLDGTASVITRCIDLRGQVRIAEVELARAEELWEDKAGSRHDVEIARIKLDTRRAQEKAITAMLRRELESSQQRLDRLEVLYRTGRISNAELAEVAGFVQVLKSVL